MNYAIGKCRHGIVQARAPMIEPAPDPIKTVSNIMDFGSNVDEWLRSGLKVETTHQTQANVEICKDCLDNHD